MNSSFREGYASLSDDGLRELVAQGPGAFAPEAWVQLQAEAADRQATDPGWLDQRPQPAAPEPERSSPNMAGRLRPVAAVAGLFCLGIIPGSVVVLGTLDESALLAWLVVGAPALVGAIRLANQAL